MGVRFTRVEDKEVKILRDMGAGLSLIVRDENICTLSEILPEKVVICGINGERNSVPQCKMRLESPIKTGEVIVGVMENLAIPGI